MGTYREGMFYVADDGQAFLKRVEPSYQESIPLHQEQHLAIWLGVWIEGFFRKLEDQGMVFFYAPPQLSEAMRMKAVALQGAFCGMVDGMRIRLLLDEEEAI